MNTYPHSAYSAGFDAALANADSSGGNGGAVHALGHDRIGADDDVAPAGMRRLHHPRYRCDTCGTVFSCPSQLEDHLARAYHGFQCLTCGAVCATRRGFDIHVGRAHSPSAWRAPGGRGGMGATIRV